MSDPITFSSLEQEKQFYSEKLSSLLRQIVLSAAYYAFNTHGWMFHTTSVIRTPEEDKELGGSGVHVIGHATDVRTRDQREACVSDVARWVNVQWEYDHHRPALMVAYGKPHGSGPHLHFQIHQNTRRRVPN